MIKNITPKEAIERIKEGAILVDVRELNEINELAYNVANQKEIPLSEFKDKYTDLGLNNELIMACRSGARSMQAAMFLAENGYTNLSNLEGGIIRWSGEGNPVK